MNRDNPRHSENAQCPCNSKSLYSACCAPLINGSRQAQTPEALMRSRYTAFSIRDAAYLLKTWHSSTRPTSLDLSESLQEKWVKLEIHHALIHLSTLHGEVEFTATSIAQKKHFSMTERSRFIKEEGKWRYVDGDCAYHQHPLSRNSPCPCGSTKKFKRCCGL